MVFTCVLHLAAGACLLTSLVKDRGGTRAALRQGWKAFEGILPQFLGVIVLTGVIMAVFDAATISRILGAHSGRLGTLGASVVAAVIGLVCA